MMQVKQATAVGWDMLDLASARLEALGDRVAGRGLADGCHQARPNLVRLR